MSKSLLIGAVRRAVPDIRADIAEVIVGRILELISDELENQRVSLTGAVLRVVPDMAEETVDKVAAELLQTISLKLASQKRGLASAVVRSVPAAQGDLAAEIVESILETISAELVSQGSFTLQKIGSLTLRHKAKSDDSMPRDPGEGVDGKRLPGVSARYHASRFLTDRVRSAAAGRGAAAAPAANDPAPLPA